MCNDKKNFRKEDVERELEEFQENSQMLEKELETSLEQAEKTIRELQQRNLRLDNENEQLRVRQDRSSCSFRYDGDNLFDQHEQQ